MGPKLAILAVIGIVYVWMIVATIPYRRAIIEEQKLNNYYNALERELVIVERSFLTMKNNPRTERADLLDKQEKLALLYWESKDFLKAVQLMQDLAKQRGEMINKEAYDEKWVNTQLHLAGIYRDINNWQASKITYEEVLKYDNSYVEGSKENAKTYEPKLARDYNNIGLVLYMEACGKEDDKEREEIMEKSAEKLKKALELWRKSKGADSFSEGNTLWNLYLVQRDLGWKKAAAETKKKAMSIDEKSGRKARAPI